MNPINVLKSFVQRGGSPKEFLNKTASNNSPVFRNLVDMANRGDTKGVEEFARNVFKERGRNYDEEFSEFMSNFK